MNAKMIWKKIHFFIFLAKMWKINYFGTPPLHHEKYEIAQGYTCDTQLSVLKHHLINHNQTRKKLYPWFCTWSSNSHLAAWLKWFMLASGTCLFFKKCPLWDIFSTSAWLEMAALQLILGMGYGPHFVIHDMICVCLTLEYIDGTFLMIPHTNVLIWKWQIGVLRPQTRQGL